MNNQRRKCLYDIMGQIEQIQGLIEDIKCEEEECRDNMPESLVGSERYERMDEAVTALDDAIEQISEAIESIQAAIDV